MDPSTGANSTSSSMYEQLRHSEIKDSQRKSAYQKFMDHSKRAIKKTVASFICLSFMLLISFVVSTYEYNQVHTQYQRVYNDVAKKLSDGHSASPANSSVNASSLHSGNSTSMTHDQADTIHDKDA